MKKYLLLASAAVFTLSASAQDRSKAVIRDAAGQERIDQNSNSNNVLANPVSAPNAKAASTIDIGTSFNIYSILGDRQNQVVYNKDINTVGFVHRQNDGGAGGTNATGIISLDYSTDGGANWTINPYQTTPTGSGATWNGNRYPNMGIYNPTTNTDPANAFMVQAGPALETGAGAADNGWAQTFRASFKLDGTLLDETYNSNSISTLGDANEWGVAGLYVTSQGTAWYVSTNNNNSGATPVAAYDVADNYSKYFIVRGDFNSGNNNFDWTVVDTITPGWNTTDNAGDTYNLAGLPNMAWSVDGNTGYMVVMGSWGANTMTRPYVMKTTDAGANWANVNDFDFSTDPTLQQYTFPLNSNPAVQRPQFGSFDVVVDANDELRIFGEINSGFSAHPDSLGFTFAARQAGFLFETTTNGTGWDVNFIDSVHVDDFEWYTTAPNNSTFNVRPQASRSQDGNKMIYTWTGSAPGLSTSREYPQVWAKGHDIVADLWTFIVNLTDGTPADFVAGYPTAAVETIENNVKDYEVPIVYGTAPGGSSLADPLTAPQWHYLREVGFDNSDFVLVLGDDAPVIEETNVSIFPNPTNGVLAINTDANNFNYTVINLVGKTVAQNTVNGNQTTVDLSNNAKGVYFVTINTENGSTTQKVILTK